ncbi:EcsC family protein [Clostridium sp. Sa3CUN1]|uniref:EcsC family protein n=1 Tax=Clostridium gallinarum TaxID=2762246 RepID=A0ABR8Q3N8_9CLOT|nr:EcsC family protein [Clostridium gallinarum]MBD7914949.1 EcsC family protein [Clostridium gallinarum]
MSKFIKKEINKLNKKENKIINKKRNTIIKNKLNPISEKIEEKIPDKLRTTLESAFYNAFKMVFKGGSKYIEKLYNKEKIKLDHDINNYAFNKRTTKKSLKLIDFQGKRSKLINSTISTVEGVGLGILGIGIPDIPIFISVILKTIYEIALSYGFNYESEEEKIYILNLINVALTSEEEKLYYSEKINEIENKIDLGIVLENNLDDEIKETAKVLSNTLLIAKFIQGLPIVGVLGGVVNYQFISKVSKYSSIKYKKRYLKKQ